MKKKQATLKDIAQQLGLSMATVSRALSQDRHVSALVTDQTRKRVQQKAAELDYSPNLMAQGFATGKTGTLGLLTYHIGLETFGRQTEQILRAADKQQYQIVMGMAADRPLPDDQTAQIKQLISRGIDGLLIHTWGGKEESERILDTVRGRVPVVTFLYPIPNLSGAVLDLVTDFFEVTDHLIRLGHERIVFLGADWNNTRPGSTKSKGYLQPSIAQVLAFKTAKFSHGLPLRFSSAPRYHPNVGRASASFCAPIPQTANRLMRSIRGVLACWQGCWQGCWQCAKALILHEIGVLACW